MKPYPEVTCDPGEITFNKELSSARVVIECALGRLKSCWQILQKQLDSRITFSVKIAIACAVLHNFGIKIGDEWEDDFYDNDDDRRNEQNNDFMQDGEDIRELLTDSLSFFKLVLIISSLDLELLLYLIFHKIDENQRSNTMILHCNLCLACMLNQYKRFPSLYKNFQQ